jgi:hypothetical protein
MKVLDVGGQDGGGPAVGGADVLLWVVDWGTASATTRAVESRPRPSGSGRVGVRSKAARGGAVREGAKRLRESSGGGRTRRQLVP